MPEPNCGINDIDSLLLAASQLFEGAVGDTEVTEVDELFLQASQSYELMVSEESSPPVNATSGNRREKLVQLFQSPIMLSLRMIRMLKMRESQQLQKKMRLNNPVGKGYMM